MFPAAANIRALWADVRGASTATLALSILPFAGGLGVSADLGRLYVVKSSLQDAIESSAYAASRIYQQTQDESDAIDMANQVFAISKPEGIYAVITGITIDRRTNSVMVNASAAAPMGLMGHITAIARSTQIEASASVTAPVTPQFRNLAAI